MTWTNEKARAVYNIAHWGGGYFDIHEGQLIANPSRQKGSTGIQLNQLADEIQQAGLVTPVLVRFTNILQDRVTQLCHAFSTAMGNHHYHGTSIRVT